MKLLFFVVCCAEMKEKKKFDVRKTNEISLV
jgi:hypothetical protein